jgi:hypothetical protein
MPHYGMPKPFQTRYLTATQMFVWSRSFHSPHEGSPCVHFSAVAVTLNPCLNRSYGEARAYLSHLSGSNYPSGLNNCSIVPLSHVIFDAVFLPWRKWRGDFARTEISGIKSFVQKDHSLPPPPHSPSWNLKTFRRLKNYITLLWTSVRSTTKQSKKRLRSGYRILRSSTSEEIRSFHGSSSQLPASHREGTGLIPGRSVWNLWCTRGNGTGLPLSTSVSSISIIPPVFHARLFIIDTIHSQKRVASLNNTL